MICDDVIWLVSEDPEAHGVLDPPAELPRMCYVRVSSVSRSEFWRAQQAGIAPVWTFRLSAAEDYHGEKVVLFRERRWRVLRTYQDGFSIELTVGEVTNDA